MDGRKNLTRWHRTPDMIAFLYGFNSGIAFAGAWLCGWRFYRRAAPSAFPRPLSMPEAVLGVGDGVVTDQNEFAARVLVQRGGIGVRFVVGVGDRRSYVLCYMGWISRESSSSLAGSNRSKCIWDELGFESTKTGSSSSSTRLTYRDIDLVLLLMKGNGRKVRAKSKYEKNRMEETMMHNIDILNENLKIQKLLYLNSFKLKFRVREREFGALSLSPDHFSQRTPNPH